MDEAPPVDQSPVRWFTAPVDGDAAALRSSPGPVAQWSEQRTHNPSRPGSNPGGPKSTRLPSGFWLRQAGQVCQRRREICPATHGRWSGRRLPRAAQTVRVRRRSGAGVRSETRRGKRLSSGRPPRPRATSRFSRRLIGWEVSSWDGPQIGGPLQPALLPIASRFGDPEKPGGLDRG